MARKRYVIQYAIPSADGSLTPMGTRAELVTGLATCNTGPDQANGSVLYGPGIELVIAPGEDPVRQMEMAVTDDDIAWTIIHRMKKQFGWKFIDPESGRTF
ncbi:MAG: hypothetical protein ACKOV8_04540 [Phycisphaerales bacterium]